MAKRIYMLCPVTIASPIEKLILDEYAERLEEDGHVVHYPARDTDQNASGFDICLTNGAAMDEADEIHLFFNSESQGSKFDLGFCFAMSFFTLRGGNKKLEIVDIGDAKGAWKNLLTKWEELR
jgi:hypothetical protein